jgi:hypothetical protein
MAREAEDCSDRCPIESYSENYKKGRSDRSDPFNWLAGHQVQF